MRLTPVERYEFAEEIRTVLDADGETLVVYEPGDGTHYEFLVKALHDVPVRAIGAGGRTAGTHMKGDHWLVAAAFDGDGRAMLVNPGGWIDPSYVLEKWRGTTAASAIVIAELLNLVAGDPDELLETWRTTLPPEYQRFVA